MATKRSNGSGWARVTCLVFLLASGAPVTAAADTHAERREKLARDRQQRRQQQEQQREQRQRVRAQEREAAAQRQRDRQEQAAAASAKAAELNAQREEAQQKGLDDEKARRTGIATRVAPPGEAMNTFLASLAKDRAAAKSAPLNLYSVKLAEPIKLPTCPRAHSFTEALKTSTPTTCVEPPLRMGAEAEAPLDHPPTTAAESEFPGLNVTLAEVRLSDAEGGKTIDATLIGGYVVELGLDVMTARQAQVEQDLRSKFTVQPSVPSVDQCRNEYGVPVGKYENLLWDLKGFKVEYRPVGKVCQTPSIVGLGYVTFRLETYRRYLQGIKNHQEATRAKM
jgi:hypothetical protein